MSVVGIDFGNENCYISVARAGGIESIANDYSMRDTPSYVAFAEKQRLMGFAAKSRHLTNIKKTFFGFKPLIGRKFKDPVVQNELSRLPYSVSENPENGEVLLHVEVMGKTTAFTPKQVAAMLFTKLKDIAEQALRTKVKDVVISVPGYYVDAERRCLMDAAAMADLNVLRLMNDTTCTALAYGIYKQDLPASEEKARNVIFVDVGHRGTQAAACSFNKGKLSVQAYTFDASVGGRNFNENIARYFADEFKEKYNLDVYSSPKAVLKLITEIEKLKKQMSANTNKLPLNIECFMGDRDVKGTVDRATFEEISSREFSAIEKVLEDCLTQAKWKKDDIHSVEIVGGSTRVTLIKTMIEKLYGKVPNTTLNADEAVSRGCALQCAILSPTFKVREFSVTDVQPYSIKLKWQADSDNGDMEVFNKFHAVPFSKMLTFYRSNNFTLAAEYGEEGVVTGNPDLGDFEISDVKPQPDGTSQKVKVKVRVNINGIFTVVSATYSEKYEIEEEVPMEVEPAKEEAGQEQNGDQKKEEAPAEEAQAEKTSPAPPKMEKQKRTVQKVIELPVTSVVIGSLTFERLTEAVNLERSLANQDKIEGERLHFKNAVEEYIYDIRSRFSADLSEFITEKDRAEYLQLLEDSENWLYEEGEDVEKSVYVDKLKELKKTGETIKKRKSEFEDRAAAYNALGHTLQMAGKIVNAYKSGDSKYEHLDAAGVEKVVKAMAEKTKWMNESVQTLNSLDKTTNPPILAVQFYDETKSFEAMANPILNKSKPKVEPPPPSKDAKDAKKETEKGDSLNGMQDNGAQPAGEVKEGMDLD